MKCNKCGREKKFQRLFESKTNYKELHEEIFRECDKEKYVEMIFEDATIEEMCEELPYLDVTRKITGELCLGCNEINIIDKKEYYSYIYEESRENIKVLYPTESMKIRYEKEIDKIPKEVYNTYIRAREQDYENRDAKLILLRKTLELILKDMKIEGGTLNEKIIGLDSNLIKIEESMHEIRKAGNEGAHNDNVTRTWSEIEDIEEKVYVIIKMIYTL